MTSRQVRVILADDHPMLFRGLTWIFERELGVKVVATAVTAKDAVNRVLEHEPDLLVLDLKLPDQDGIWVLSQIQEKVSRTRTIIFTGAEDPAEEQRALETGARAVVRKKQHVLDLIAASAKVLGISRPPKDLESTDGAVPWVLRELTRRQRRVVELVARGFTCAQIGQKLGIGRKTVETHRERAMATLGLTEKHELVALLLETGVIGQA